MIIKLSGLSTESLVKPAKKAELDLDVDRPSGNSEDDNFDEVTPLVRSVVKHFKPFNISGGSTW